MNQCKKYEDSRGTLLFPIKNNCYANELTNLTKECTISINKKNVFRGLHINSFSKIITCISGSFIDIIVNLDTLIPEYYPIKSGEQVYCPGGYAHGFISLEDNSILSYFIEDIFENEPGGLLNYKDPVLDIKLPVLDTDILINEKDSTAPYLEFEYFLLGSKGYIGSSILRELKINKMKVLCLKNRMNEIESISKLIKIYKPKYFINAAGLTGIGSVKWCNDNKKETLMTNVIEQIGILNMCNKYNVHCTLIGSGAIYKDSIIEKTEEDKGDLISEYYSECRIMLEEMVSNFENYLFLRMNYPISKKDNPKNLLTKLKNYNQIDNIKLSITNLDSLCPIMIKMIEHNKTGKFNFVNKGQIEIPKILEIININKEIKSSNRESIKLNTDKLEKIYNIETIEQSLMSNL